MAEYIPHESLQITPTPVATPTPTPEPTPTPSPTPEPMEHLSAYVDREEARTYKTYTLLDNNAANMPVMSTVLPSGWTGTGIVLWDAHSSDKPGRYVFTAVSSDGKAGLTMSSAMKFVDVRLAEFMELPLDYVLPGLPKQKVMEAPDICARFVPTFNSNLGDVMITGSSDFDTSAFLSQYTGSLEAFFHSLQNAGLQVEQPYASAKQLSGSASINGSQCEISVDMVTSGFSCFDYNSGFGISMDYWNLDYLCVYYAPPGLMDSYRADMELIMRNFYANQKWELLNDTVAADVNAYLAQDMQATYGDMVQYAQGVVTTVESRADTSTSFGKYSALSSLDFTSGLSVNSYRDFQTDLYTASVEMRWQNIWLAESGDIIGVNDEEYDPNEDDTQNMQGWNKVS